MQPFHGDFLLQVALLWQYVRPDILHSSVLVTHLTYQVGQHFVLHHAVDLHVCVFLYGYAHSTGSGVFWVYREITPCHITAFTHIPPRHVSWTWHYFQITTNKMQRFLIYLFLQTLYMFQAVPWNSISSTIAASSSIDWQYLKLYVQFCAPDDGRRNRLKHVDHL